METTMLALDALSGIIQTIIVYGLGIIIFKTYMDKADRLEREAINNGFAYFDPKTKKFTWKELHD